MGDEGNTCKHIDAGGQNIEPVYCGRRSRSVVVTFVKGLVSDAWPVCGIHERFWKARGYSVRRERVMKGGE